ncbi:MAG TPA: putative 2OG-Fe(II) oxygenase [Rhizomicrobium sp.]
MERPVPTEAFAKLLKGAAGQASQRPAFHIDRARLLFKEADYLGAVDAFETAARLDPAGFHAWAELAAVHFRLGRYETALDLCGRAAPQTPEVLRERARALLKLGRGAEARAALLSALEQNDAEDALEMLLRLLAADSDGTKLIEVCDGLAPRYAAMAPARAYRAIGLSRIGRTADALKIMDLERYVSRVAFVPPAALGTAAQFNRALADEILADPSPFPPIRDNLELNWDPDRGNSPRFFVLYAFIRSEMQRYLDEMPGRGLDSVMPPRPSIAKFTPFNVILRNDGSNGEHIHAPSYVSAVYHVLVPDSVAQASDTRGALVLGCCTTHTGGYAPCWGVRHIKPVAGWLTLFPAHVFHDVVPPRTDSPRVSVAADLIPVRD